MQKEMLQVQEMWQPNDDDPEGHPKRYKDTELQQLLNDLSFDEKFT